MSRVYLGGVAVLAMASAQVAAGQTPGPSDAVAAAAVTQSPDGRTTKYAAAYFTQFAPRTALDIVRRVPGFQLDLGSTQTDQGQVDVRGFAGTAGNVVFNGARPSTKAEKLDVTLARIPAQRVVSVEVSPGDRFGSDYAGKSQVLNILMSAQGGFDANVTAAGSRRYNGYVNKDLSGSALYRTGANSFNLSAGTGRNRQIEEGTDTLTEAGSGDPVAFRRKTNSYFNRDPYLAGSWALEHGSDSAFRLNARWQPSRFDLTQRNRVTPADGPAHDDNLFQKYRDPVIELGGDVTRPLAGGAIKLVGLATRRKRDDFDAYLQHGGLIEADSSVVGGFEQTVKARRNETIGRLSWTRSALAGFSVEAGAEAALNTLDSNVDFAQIDQNGARVPITLPIADAQVKEKRGEVYVNLGKDLSPALRIDGGVNYEFSHLTVSGDATADRRLKFVKPNVALDWKPGADWHMRLSVRRTVAQLDFYDFISVADLSASRVNGGNAELQPQRTWEFRLTAEHPLLGDGLVKLDLGHDLISMVQDRILIEGENGTKFDAPGNLGTGKRYFATLTLDAPLGRLWNGLRFKFDGMVQHTRVDDPISGDPRDFSGFFPRWQWTVDLRRDVGRLSYGVNVNDARRITFFRTDEFDSNFNGGPLGTAFVEYRPNPQTSLSLNLERTHGSRLRTIFAPNREAPTDVIQEFRERSRHLSVGLTLKQSFGGAGGGSGVASKN